MYYEQCAQTVKYVFDTSYVYVYEKVYENNETIKRSSQNVFRLSLIIIQASSEGEEK